MNNKPLVSFFLVTYNRKIISMQTLRKIYEQTYRPIEIVVADNNSKDGTPDLIEKNFPDVKLIRLNRNFGGLAGRNIACKKTTGKYIVSLDDDSFPGKECIIRMVERFEEDPQLGLIAFNIYNYNSFINNYYDEKHLSSGITSSENYYWSGCGGGYRREVVEKYGYWEEWGHTSPYELAISAKVMKMGMVAKNYSDIYVFHSFASIENKKSSGNKWSYPVEESNKSRVGQKGNYTSTRNALLFVLKFHPLNHKTLIWIVKYIWYVAYDFIQRRRLTLVKALVNGFAKTNQMHNERILINQKQAEKIAIGFNFKGK